jgi:hypothetical protein
MSQERRVAQHRVVLWGSLFDDFPVAGTAIEARHMLGGSRPDVASEERERMVARGIVLVSRMAQALPPEASLAAILQERLPELYGRP